MTSLLRTATIAATLLLMPASALLHGADDPATAPAPTPAAAPAPTPDAPKAEHKKKKKEAPVPVDVVATAAASKHFTILSQAIVAAELTDTLKAAGPFTVFAPTDEAFAKIPKADLDALLKDAAKLKAVLLGHVVAGKLAAADLAKWKDGDKVATVGGGSLTVAVAADGKITIDGAAVSTKDIDATNGVIHAIDTVILPK